MIAVLRGVSGSALARRVWSLLDELVGHLPSLMGSKSNHIIDLRRKNKNLSSFVLTEITSMLIEHVQLGRLCLGLCACGACVSYPLFKWGNGGQGEAATPPVLP